jgi:DNA-binding CsgD family transcriptional regulator
VVVDDGRLLGALRDALSSSLDIREVMQRVHPLLLALTGSDHAALGVSQRGRPAEFEWLATDLSRDFFAAYAELAPHDFVHSAVAAVPNRVLCDSDMLPRDRLEASVIYQRARDLHTPLEQVMAVMLETGEGYGSGLAVYRSRRRDFSERDRTLLQELTPAFVNAVRNCRLFAAVTHRADLLSRLLDDAQRATIVIRIASGEVVRTRAAEPLLAKWFAHGGGSDGGLPRLLRDRVGWWSRQSRDITPLRLRRGAAVWGIVRPHWLTESGERYLVLTLEEGEYSTKLPKAWCALLTAREREVVQKVLEGWDNSLVASEIGCAEATVKKHLQHVFDKLGVSTRGQLMARARAR